MRQGEVVQGRALSSACLVPRYTDNLMEFCLRAPRSPVLALDTAG